MDAWVLGSSGSAGIGAVVDLGALSSTKRLSAGQK